MVIDRVNCLGKLGDIADASTILELEMLKVRMKNLAGIFRRKVREIACPFAGLIGDDQFKVSILGWTRSGSMVPNSTAGKISIRGV